MTIYAIGDVQGCYSQLRQLLEKIHFSEDKDQLWFTGDLVNRGPDSLKVIQFVQDLKANAISVLGNHDLHMLAVLTGFERQRPKDTLNSIINSPRKNEIIDWIRQLPLMHTESHNVLVHAGIYPKWKVTEAQLYAKEVETLLKSDNFLDFFPHMYGNKPSLWSENLQSWDRLRFITNSFTRMRYIDDELNLSLKFKGSPGNAPKGLKPWFFSHEEQRKNYRIIFGHWSTLGLINKPDIVSLDTGCLWGGSLTAMSIEDEPKIFSLACEQTLAPK